MSREFEDKSVCVTKKIVIGKRAYDTLQKFKTESGLSENEIIELLILDAHCSRLLSNMICHVCNKERRKLVTDKEKDDTCINNCPLKRLYYRGHPTHKDLFRDLIMAEAGNEYMKAQFATLFKEDMNING